MSAILTNPRAFVLMIALIIVSGLAALSALPRDEDPRIANRNAFVMTDFPGASAERVEALVTEPLENRLRELPEIEHINSRSSAGFSSLTVELVDSVGMEQTDAVWAEVRDKLEQARMELPQGASKPVLEERRTYPYTLIFALTWDFAGSEPDILTLGRYADELESRLRSLSGTDYVGIHGRPREEIIVDVDAAKAGLLGLSPHEIGETVFQSDAKVTAGEINNDRLRVAVEVEGALDTLERVRLIPLRHNADGSAVQVGDVAVVSRQPRSPARELAVIGGKPSVVVGVRMLTGLRSDLWSAKARSVVAGLQHQLPTNIKIETIFDQQRYTATRLDGLIGNIILGFALIACVLLFTLGWRAALVVASALPLTVLFAFACMNVIDLPIHQMSVVGLIVALGIMVDNAIVMVDTVDRNKRRGMSGLEATLQAVKHLWLPLLGSTLTTILAFMPIVLMPGASGEFVGGIGLTVVFSLMGSYLISHFIIAGLAGRFLINPSSDKRDVDRQGSAAWFFEGVKTPELAVHFRRSIAWGLANPKRVIVIVMLLPLLGFGFGSRLPEQFFPPATRDMINIEIYMPLASSINNTLAVTEKINAELNSIDGMKSLHWFVGRSAPSFYYNLMQGKDGSPNYAQAMFTAESAAEGIRLIPILQQRLDELFPEAQVVIRRLEQGPPFDAPVELRLTGPDLNVLKDLGDQLRLQVMSVEHVVHARTSLSEVVPKIWLSVDENLARAGRLSLTEVAGQLHDGVDGAITGSILEGTESLPVRVQASGQKQMDVGGVHSWLLVPGETHTAAQPIPYASLGDVDIRPALGSILRRNGERINMVRLFIRDGVLPATVLEKVKLSLVEQQETLPPGYRLSFAGEDEKRDEAVTKLVGSMGLIVVLLIVAVVASFNSFRLSGVVFVVAIQAAGLGMLALSVAGAPFGFTSIIGLMGLIGLAINAAIVILAELKSDTAAIKGDAGAVLNGVMSCSRHIVSTTITTIMGFLPLILFGGDFWAPFAFIMAGGTLLTTLLSFYFVPVVFIIMSRYRPFELAAFGAVEPGVQAAG